MEQCRSRFHGDQCVREIGHTDRHRHRHGIGGILWADADEDRMYSESDLKAAKEDAYKLGFESAVAIGGRERAALLDDFAKLATEWSIRTYEYSDFDICSDKLLALLKARGWRDENEHANR